MSAKSNSSKILLAGCSALALIPAAPAFAQDPETVDTNVIVVTATLRETTLQDVPFSVNAQTEEAIQRANATTMEELARDVAGLSIQNLGPGQSQVSVRGVSAGQVVRDQPGVKEQVGVYLDDTVISLSLFTPDIDLFDLNRVETLRGPQGTLFGSGSVGGTLRYITNQPDPTQFEGVIEGNVNLVDGDDIGGHLRGMINVPIGDTLAIRAVAYGQRYGGFVDALFENGPDEEDINSGTRFGGRIALAFTPNENITITPRVLYQEIDVDGFNRQEVFNLYANPHTTTRPPIQLGEREQYLLLQERFLDETMIADLTATFEFGGVALTSVSSYINRDILVSRDASALTGSVSVDLGFPDEAVLLPSNLRDTTDLETFTQEVRLGSAEPGPFQWLIGGFYSKVDRVYAQRLPTPGYDAFTDAALGAGTSAAVANGFPANSPYNADLPYDIEQLAAFGEISYDITDAITLTAGARYYDFSEVRSFTSGGLFSNGDERTDETSSNGITPRLIASWDVHPDITVNAQVSRGFRLGGVNDPLNLPLCSDEDEAIFGGFQDYDDETLWNYETGVKIQIPEVTFNAAAFYTDISNLQVTLDAGSCSSRIVFNVPEAHTAGVEFEFTAHPIEGVDVGFSGSVVEARFDSTVVDGNGNVIGGIRTGNRLPSVPNVQLAANAAYSFPIGTGESIGFLRASLQYVGSRFTQPSDQENNPRGFVSGLPFGGANGNDVTIINLKLPGYELVNLSAGVELGGGTDVTVYVNNVFDENPLLSFDRERGGRARLGFNIGQPRTYGLTVRQRF
ncbi:MAG: TonB-dependent receptor [Sphingomonadaceae bacterium]|nr:TonB-dependent receptor [Sphingomonadaceae bacterium]